MIFSPTQPFKINGKFFIPNLNKEYNGDLIYDFEKGIRIELHDLPLNFSHYYIPYIQGRSFGKPHSYTLIDAQYDRSEHSADRVALSSISSYQVDTVLFGKHFTDNQELYFNSVSFSYSNLREWINRPSIFTEFSADKGPNTLFKQLPSIQGNLNKLFDFEIEFSNNGSYQNESFEINIKQKTFFNIISKNNKLHLSEFLIINEIVKYFFMFMQGSYVIEESILCKNGSDSVQLLHYNPHFAKPKEFDANTRFVHTFNSICIAFESLIKKWIEKYEEMPDFFNLYFQNVINDSLFITDRFENLFQSVLHYYNYKFKDEITAKEDYDLFINNMKNKLDPNEEKFIERFRNLGNKRSLSVQLDTVFSQLSYLNNQPDKKKYLREFVEIRNKISHATRNNTPKFMADVSNMTHNLTALVSSLILYEINYGKHT